MSINNIERARPMETAPQNGTMLRLLIDYSSEANAAEIEALGAKGYVWPWTPLEDAMWAWTIGFNNLDNNEDDGVWKFVGWDWQQDQFVHGHGVPIGWLPWENPPADRSAEAVILAEIATERRRQIEAKGWTPDHDDAHDDGDLIKAAHAYLDASVERLAGTSDASNRLMPPDIWPWEDAAWKPKSNRRDLVRAAALIVAELERMDRAHQQFLKLIAGRFASRARLDDQAALQHAQITLEVYLRDEGVEVGHPAIAWDEDGANAVADDELEHWEEG